MASELGSDDWAAEFARTGEVRIPPRRRITGLKTLVFGFVLANQLAAIASAALGTRNWLWWPLFCVPFAALFLPLFWTYAGMFLFGRPVLVIDNSGVSLGRKRLAWEDVTTVESSKSPRRSDPRRPVDASRGWLGFVTLVPPTQRRKRQISVGGDHVKDLEGLAVWLDALKTERQLGDRTV